MDTDNMCPSTCSLVKHLLSLQYLAITAKTKGRMRKLWLRQCCLPNNCGLCCIFTPLTCLNWCLRPTESGQSETNTNQENLITAVAYEESHNWNMRRRLHGNSKNLSFGNLFKISASQILISKNKHTRK